MSGETRTSVSGWTVDTLREFLLGLINGLREFVIGLMNERDVRYGQRFAEIIEAQRVAKDAVGTALLAQQQAVQRAEEANDKKFEQLANQRRVSDDKSGLMMPRAEAEQRYNALDQKTQQLLAALNEKITDMAARIDRTEGRSGGFSAGWTYLVAAVIATGVVVGIIVRFAPP